MVLKAKHTNVCDKDTTQNNSLKGLVKKGNFELFTMINGIDLCMTKKQSEITDLLLAFAAQISKKAQRQNKSELKTYFFSCL